MDFYTVLRILFITSSQVEGDLISFQEHNRRIRGEEIRRSFYIEISVEKIKEKPYSKKRKL
jgi:small subunit ribosomal protein S4